MLDFSCSLAEIADDIANKYLRLPFPTSYHENGFLDFTKLREEKINKSLIHRTLHGHLNTCRTTLLIPILFAFYKKNIDKFPEDFQKEINNFTERQLKMLQIVALMRTSGRTAGEGPGKKFCEQSKKECLNYLYLLGLNDTDGINDLTRSIVESEESDATKFSLPSCLLKDAALLETFRDSYKKTISLKYFAISQKLNTESAPGIIGEFVKICCAHVEIIKRHQGFFLTTLEEIKDYPGLSWPSHSELNDYENIKKLEYDQFCFQFCEKDITALYEIINPPEILTYANNLRKLPTAELYKQYIQETLFVSQKTKLTTREKDYVLARKLWSDVVSKTAEENTKYLEKNDVKSEVIKRIKDILESDKNLLSANAEIIYEHCLHNLYENTLVTVTLNTTFLKNNFKDFQILNFWEFPHIRYKGYTEDRISTEEKYFKFLPPDLYADFIKNKIARPRHGSLLLLDENNYPKKTECYGKSFLVLKKVAMLNTLFAPSDTLMAWRDQKKIYKLVTYHHFELFLQQMPDTKLKMMVTWALTGKLSQEYNPGSGRDYGYIEVQLPAINFFDANLIESMHIHPQDYKLSIEEKSKIESLGIKVFNTDNQPYKEIVDELTESIKQDNAKQVNNILSRYTELRNITLEDGYLLHHFAAKHGSLKCLELFHHLHYDFSQCIKYNIDLKTVAFTHKKIAALNFILNVLQQNMAENEILECALVLAEQDDIVGLKKILIDAEQIKKFANTIIHHAAQYGSLSILKYFAELKYSFTFYLNNRNPLQKASEANQLEALKFIVNYINQNTKKSLTTIINEPKNSPLLLACKANHSSIIDYLLQIDADPRSVLTWAMTNNKLNVLKALVQHLDIETLKDFLLLAKQNKNEAVALVIAKVYLPLQIKQLETNLHKSSNITFFKHRKIKNLQTINETLAKTRGEKLHTCITKMYKSI